MTGGKYEVGRRQGRRAYITFGYHRRPPARTRARGRRPDYIRAAAPAADPCGPGPLLHHVGQVPEGALQLTASEPPKRRTRQPETQWQ